MSMPCCDFQISENHRCGSYAFNLWQEGIEQKYCDRHHWQDEATRLRAEVEALRAGAPDAERYRLIKAKAHFNPESWGYYPASYLVRIWDNEKKPMGNATLDEYVDAARAEQENTTRL